jgi:hypothetical protein
MPGFRDVRIIVSAFPILGWTHLIVVQFPFLNRSNPDRVDLHGQVGQTTRFTESHLTGPEGCHPSNAEPECELEISVYSYTDWYRYNLACEKTFNAGSAGDGRDETAPEAVYSAKSVSTPGLKSL